MNLDRPCPTCRSVGTLRLDETDLTTRIGGRTFITRVPAVVCASCEEAIFSAETVSSVEESVTRALATEGAGEASALRWMRKGARLSGVELGRLLGVAPETVSRWESGSQAPDRATVAVIAELALDALEGRTDTRARLEALARSSALDETPRRLALPSRAA